MTINILRNPKSFMGMVKFDVEVAKAYPTDNRTYEVYVRKTENGENVHIGVWACGQWFYRYLEYTEPRGIDGKIVFKEMCRVQY